jgi:hypothetical protein
MDGHDPLSRSAHVLRPLGISVGLARNFVPDLVYGLWRKGWDRRGVLALQKLGLFILVVLRPAMELLVYGHVYGAHDGLRFSGIETLGTEP